MVENKLSFAKDASTHSPSMFSNFSYQFWRVHIKILVESIDQGIWDTIMNRQFILKHVDKLMLVY